jgi:hypothetical protein
LAEQVIKRELIDSEDAQAAQAAVKRLMRAYAREKNKRASESEGSSRVEPMVDSGAKAAE